MSLSQKREIPRDKHPEQLLSGILKLFLIMVSIDIRTLIL